MLWLIGSKVGVIIAPRIKAPTTANFRYLESILGVTIPILAKKKAKSGVSKQRPREKSSLTISETKFPTLI